MRCLRSVVTFELYPALCGLSERNTYIELPLVIWFDAWVKVHMVLSGVMMMTVKLVSG